MALDKVFVDKYRMLVIHIDSRAIVILIDNQLSLRCTIGPEVIKLFSCSTQLSMKFHLVIKIKIPTVKTVFMLSSAEHAQLS